MDASQHTCEVQEVRWHGQSRLIRCSDHCVVLDYRFSASGCCGSIAGAHVAGDIREKIYPNAPLANHSLFTGAHAAFDDNTVEKLNNDSMIHLSRCFDAILAGRSDDPQLDACEPLVVNSMMMCSYQSAMRQDS